MTYKNTARLLMLGLAGLLLAACATTRDTQPNLSGAWLLSTETGMGSQDANLLLEQNGSQLTGTLTSQMGAADITGEVNGTDVQFGFDIQAQGMSLTLNYVGALEDDAIRGIVSLGDFGEGAFVAQRQEL